MTEVHKYSQWLDYANDDLKAAKELLKTYCLCPFAASCRKSFKSLFGF
ncbi:hypothetical protein SAMN04244560_00172 [Thermoanaerobacter thermohydrosulfuricus]|uniref:Uncharacterized protein n=1 Tax=Thermoanaerobacter thermohydrosulfuricus TaxID=1516 RepID=A0A1I1Z0F8_THETY|nr:MULTISPECIES: hypothetical protein [Thermoanaerobacter]UZQ82475.1 hypothetical protein OEI98_002336 [Thermoanaerobacter sp. RKWS2]SDF04710.1 hypothetical protein SAMN04244560_00172 [Thermoanaerobacter thermohydrosulfuricus]SFE25296.1 hypothetical protein SAMN04324257_01111 [Thermoanaerobacter thermohydrosulfuricus]